MRRLKQWVFIGCSLAIWCGQGTVVYGQDTAAKDAAATAQTFTISVQDGTVRAALKQLFEAAHAQYSIDSRVSGFVTLHIVDQAFEPALRILLRSSSSPLSYTREGGVYYIKPRMVPNIPDELPPPSVPAHSTKPTASDGLRVDVLTLTYADPYDLSSLLGITIVPFGTRFSSTASGAGTSGTAASGAGGIKGNTGGTSGSGGSAGINGGTLISNDTNNDILRIGY